MPRVETPTASAPNSFLTASSKLRKWLNKLLANDVWLAICVTIAVILLGVCLGLYSNRLIPVNSDPGAHYNHEQWTHLSFLSNWDGPQYLRIVQHGYSSGDDGFFPLYPLLTRGVMFGLRSPLISALAVAWVAFGGAVYAYIKLLKLLYNSLDRAAIVQALLLFVLFPTGVFLFATYTESTLLLCVLAASCAALKRRPLWAGAWGMLAAAAHPNGIFVIPLVALILYQKGISRWQIAVSAAFSSLGLLSYMLFLAIRFYNPLQFLSDQRHNGWLQQGNYLTHLANSATVFGVLLFVLVAIAAVYWWRRHNWGFTAYTLLFLLLPLVGGVFGGFSRYSLAVFPAQLMLFERYRDRKLAYPLVVAVFAISWTYFVIHYAAGYTGGA